MQRRQQIQQRQVPVRASTTSTLSTSKKIAIASLICYAAYKLFKYTKRSKNPISSENQKQFVIIPNNNNSDDSEKQIAFEKQFSKTEDEELIEYRVFYVAKDTIVQKQGKLLFTITETEALAALQNYGELSSLDASLYHVQVTDNGKSVTFTRKLTKDGVVEQPTRQALEQLKQEQNRQWYWRAAEYMLVGVAAAYIYK